MTKVILKSIVKKELAWWIQSLELSNGWCIIQPPSQTFQQIDASKEGWGRVCLKTRTGSLWLKKEQEQCSNRGYCKNRNSTGTSSDKACTFNLQQNDELSVHIQIANRQLGSPELLFKKQPLQRVTTNFFKSYFQRDNGIPCHTSDHDYYLVPPRIPESSDILGIKDSKGFYRVQNMSKNIKINLQGNQRYLYLYSILDELQREWSHKHLYFIPTCASIYMTFRKVEPENVAFIKLTTPTLQIHTQNPELLRLSMKNSVLLPQQPNLSVNSFGELNPLFQNQTLQ